MKSDISIKFCTGVGTVTGANFLLEVGKKGEGYRVKGEGNHNVNASTSPSTLNPLPYKILIDCGLVQGEKVANLENAEAFPYDLDSIDALFITHAHLDHVGRIPKLIKDGYKGPIYSTPQTKELAELVMNDAVSILLGEAERDKGQPLYSRDDVRAVMPLWKTIDYHETLELNSSISIYLKDAGHILGSSMIEVTIEGEGYRVKGEGNHNVNASTSPSTLNPVPCKILFTGDLGNSPAPLLRDTEPIGDVDYLVMESVYGDRNHEERAERVNKLQKVIVDTIGRGGTLVIPAFSIDRTQVLLYELNNMVEQKKIPSVPVFVDSPLAIKATDVYKANEDLFNDKVRAQIKAGDDIFQFKNLEYTMSSGQSDDITKIKGAKIILAGSGMSVGGRIVSHEQYYMDDPRNTILLVGYQSAGSLGRELADGARKVRIHGESVKVKAQIETLYGYSAHKDGDHLVEFVSTGTDKLKKVFVVMGEPGASMHLAQRVNDELGVKAVVPERMKEYFLE